MGEQGRLGALLPQLTRIDPELAVVARSWGRLSPPLRAAVLAIIGSTSSNEYDGETGWESADRTP
jgi:hypothetical protein